MRKNNLPVRGDGTPIRKPRKKFTWDDLELTLLSLPTIAWLVAFCYVPMFGIVFALKNYKYKPGKGTGLICITFIGRSARGVRRAWL